MISLSNGRGISYFMARQTLNQANSLQGVVDKLIISWERVWGRMRKGHVNTPSGIMCDDTEHSINPAEFKNIL